MDFAAAVGLCVLCCGRLSLFLLSKFVVFVFVADRVPYQQQKQRNTQTWRGGKGKAAHNTKPKPRRNSVGHVQLDLSIHVLGTLPKIPYPDTKVFSLAAACGSTCFSKYLNNVMADRPCRPQWAKAHRAYVASPTTVLIWVNTRNNKLIWHHHDNSNCKMSFFFVCSCLNNRSGEFVDHFCCLLRSLARSKLLLH